MNYTGYLLAFTAATAYACLPVFYKKLGLDYSPYLMMLTNSLPITILAAVLYFSQKGMVEMSSVPTKDFAWMLGLGLWNFFAFVLYLAALKQVKVFEYEMIGMIAPLVAGLIAYVVLKETLTIYHFIGFTLVAIGLFIALKFGASGVKA